MVTFNKWRSLADGSEISAIPDSVEYQFAASSASNGSDWTSEDGSLTLSVIGSPTIQSGALNGEDTVYYDGADDGHRGTNVNISQIFGIVAVYQYPTTGQGSSRGIGDTNSTRAYLDPDGVNSSFEMSAGNYIGNAATDTNWHIHSGYFAGSNSENRLDGSTNVQGDAGTNSLEEIDVAYNQNGTTYTELEVAEFWILANPSLQEITDSEQILNDKYAVY